MVWEICNVFFLFPGDTFHLENGDEVVQQPWIMPHTFVELEHPDHNPQTILKLVDQFSRKLIVDLCFSFHLEKLERKQSFWGNYKLVLSPAHRIKDPLEFCEYL